MYNSIYIFFIFKEIVWFEIVLNIEVRYEMKFKSSRVDIFFLDDPLI